MPSNKSPFNYITGYNFDYVDVELKSDLQRKGCDCTDNCRDKAKCSCWQLTVQRLLGRPLKKDDLREHKKVGYKNMRLETVIPTGLIECGGNCKCCADKCQNRVVQHGLQHELELFETSNRGWGVRTRNDLPPGMFICNYAGNVLLDSVADKCEITTYQFKVPTLYSESNLDEDLENEQVPKPKRLKFPHEYDVVQTVINYFPPIPGFNTKNYPENELAEAKTGNGFVIDALNHGNIARYFNVRQLLFCP